MDEKETQRLQEYHILALAEIGNPIEQASQWLASYLVSSEMSWSDFLAADLRQIIDRSMYLIEHSNRIWSHLLPGGSSGDPLEHPDTTRLRVLMEMIEKDRPSSDNKPWHIIRDMAEYLAGEGMLVGYKADSFNKEECIVLAIRDDWLILRKRDMTLHRWRPVSFENISNPYADETLVGDVVGVYKGDWEGPDPLANPADWSEI